MRKYLVVVLLFSSVYMLGSMKKFSSRVSSSASKRRAMTVPKKVARKKVVSEQKNMPVTAQQSSFTEQDVMTLVADTHMLEDRVVHDKIEDVYKEVAGEVDHYAQKFALETKQELQGIRQISEFDQVVEDALRSFKSQMTTVTQKATDSYNQFLQEHGQTIDPFNLTKEQQEVSRTVTQLTQDAVRRMESMIEAMRAVLLEKKITYGFQHRKPGQQQNMVITDDEVSSATRIMSSFVAQFTEKILEESGDKVLKKIGQSVRKDIKKTIPGIEKIIPEQIKEQLDTFKGAVDTSSLQKWLDERGLTMQALKHAIRFAYPVALAAQKQHVEVQVSTTLSEQEQEFLKNRIPKVQQVLEESFDIDVPLRLAFCCSGGGNRAMIGTLGLFTAAARHNFLQATTYIAGLSGSTWMMVPWCYLSATNKFGRDYRTSLKQLSDMLMKVLNYSCSVSVQGMCPAPLLDSDTNVSFAYNLAKRFAYDKPITAVDIHGALVGNYALDKVGYDRLEVTWSSIEQKMQNGDLPLPLCAAAIDLATQSTRIQRDTTAGYAFFETSPFQAGCPSLGYIPIATLGSKFEDGVMIERALEYPLSFYLGVYGSAFSIAMNDVIDRLPKPTFTVLGKEVAVPVNTWVRKAIGNANDNIRAQRYEKTHARFSNYTFGQDESPIGDEGMFALFDAGIFINLPAPLLFERPERAVDVVVMYDSNPKSLAQLYALSKLFKKKGIKVPDMSKVTMKEFLSKPMLVFNDPRVKSYDGSMPTLLYFRTPNQDVSQFPYNIDLQKYPDIKMPIDNSKYPYITPNFAYPSPYFKNLSQTMEAIFESQVPAMKDIIQMVAKNKKNNSLGVDRIDTLDDI